MASGLTLRAPVTGKLTTAFAVRQKADYAAPSLVVHVTLAVAHCACLKAFAGHQISIYWQFNVLVEVASQVGIKISRLILFLGRFADQLDAVLFGVCKQRLSKIFGLNGFTGGQHLDSLGFAILAVGRTHGSKDRAEVCRACRVCNNLAVGQRGLEDYGYLAP